MPKININTDFDKLPSREAQSRRRSGWSRSNFYKYKGEYCWTVIKRIILHYEGKNVNLAFSHYCKLMPDYLQKEFWEYFDENVINWAYRPSYLIDNNGYIKIIRQKSKKSIVFTSFDYKTEKNDPDYSNFRFKNNQTPKPKWMILGKDFFEPEKYIVTSGFSKQFNSKSSKNYKQLVYEDIKAKRKFDRALKLEQSKTAYCYLTKEELKNKSNEDDIINRDRLGFDKNSFKDSNYHGQKRKNQIK